MDIAIWIQSIAILTDGYSTRIKKVYRVQVKSVNVPIVAAGGIACCKGVNAAMALGSGGVQVRERLCFG